VVVARRRREGGTNELTAAATERRTSTAECVFNSSSLSASLFADTAARGCLRELAARESSGRKKRRKRRGKEARDLFPLLREKSRLESDYVSKERRKKKKKLNLLVARPPSGPLVSPTRFE
jgi:hypothetical protein